MLIEAVYKIRNSDFFYNDYNTRVKFDKVINFLVPIKYAIIPSKKLKPRVNNKPRIIVSLTTIPSRIDRSWMVVESILRQSYKPDKIIMWLGKDKFKSIKLPKIYKDLMKKGLEIQYCEDLCAHTKYFYALQKYPNDIIITVDDDIYYQKDMIKGLINTYKKYPHDVCAHWVWEMKYGKKGQLLPCKTFKTGDQVKNQRPSHYLTALGVGGVLYPPRCVGKETFNKDNIIKLSYRQDDIWLKAMELLYRTKVAKVNECYRIPTILAGTQKEALRYSNVYKNENDIQYKQVFDYYKITEENFKK